MVVVNVNFQGHLCTECATKANKNSDDNLNLGRFAHHRCYVGNPECGLVGETLLYLQDHFPNKNTLEFILFYRQFRFYSLYPLDLIAYPKE